MPYISKKARQELQDRAPSGPGELNYILTIFCKDYVNNHEESYQTYNDILGALEGCKQEVYRRWISVYEDKKIQENGDV